MLGELTRFTDGDISFLVAGDGDHGAGRGIEFFKFHDSRTCWENTRFLY
jgi:hypothetical protein